MQILTLLPKLMWVFVAEIGKRDQKKALSNSSKYSNETFSFSTLLWFVSWSLVIYVCFTSIAAGIQLEHQIKNSILLKKYLFSVNCIAGFLEAVTGFTWILLVVLSVLTKFRDMSETYQVYNIWKIYS